MDRESSLPPLNKLILPIGLALLLLLLGTAVDLLFTHLEILYRDIFRYLGFPHLYDRLSGKAFDVKVLTLILLNAFFCLAILLSTFRDRVRRRVILWAYAGVLLVPLSFALLVKLTGDDPMLRSRSRAIIDYLLLTPLPVVFLMPVLVLLRVSKPVN